MALYQILDENGGVWVSARTLQSVGVKTRADALRVAKHESICGDGAIFTVRTIKVPKKKDENKILASLDDN